MSTPSRENIRSRLRQRVQQGAHVVTRVTRRFAPLGDVESGPPPDHQAYIKADYSLCCAYHEERSFQTVRSWFA
jgi:hypothetical protein